MPSQRKNPPSKTATVYIIHACKANGENQKLGAEVKVSSGDANLLVGLGRAVREKDEAAQIVKDKVAAKKALDALIAEQNGGKVVKAKQPVTATR